MKIECLVVGQLQTNCYLVWSKENQETAVIDPGDDADFIIRRISDFNLLPKFLLTTHGHFDHVLAVTELKLAFKIPFLMHSADLPILKRIQSSARHFTGLAVDPVSIPDKFIKEGDSISFGKEKLQVRETPGHTPGGVAFYSRGVLFSGDTLFADGVGRTDFSYSSKQDLQKSIKKLLKLPSNTPVYPGHGRPTRIADVFTIKETDQGE